MTWITAAITAAAIMAVVSIVDSHLISKRLPSLRAFLFPIGIMHITVGLIILNLYPLPAGTGTTPLMVAIGSGFIRVAGALPMLKAMRSEEVSRIIPVVNTSPIFVVILAVPILGETLGYTEWLAIFMTVAGAVLISIRRNSTGQGVRLHKPLMVLIISSMLFGVATTASKYALDYITFWNMYGLNATCMGTVFLLFSVHPRTLKEVRDISKRNQVLVLILLNECIAVVGIILSFWAIERGRVSLVSTISSVRPAFVFVIALALSLFFPAVLSERLSRDIVVIKIISIGLVIGGVTLLTLGG